MVEQLFRDILMSCKHVAMLGREFYDTKFVGVDKSNWIHQGFLEKVNIFFVLLMKTSVKSRIGYSPLLSLIEDRPLKSTSKAVCHIHVNLIYATYQLMRIIYHGFNFKFFFKLRGFFKIRNIFRRIFHPIRILQINTIININLYAKYSKYTLFKE